jgi:FO synthase subunit 1
VSLIPITYSPAHTLVPTYECFNRCTYCNFRVDPGQDNWLSLATAKTRLQALQNTGVTEILILSGEVHPRSPRRQEWGDRLYELAALALRMGFFSHTNAGPLSRTEMARLKTVNVSLGLMLEQLTPKLLETVHRHAPSKDPQQRLQQLQLAGELEIPFTTGLLLGIGETESDIEESLTAIANCHQQYGHIQEVILQPHSPGQSQTQPAPAYSATQLIRVIQLARNILPAEVTIQIPPNLIANRSDLLACVQAGARDLGGIVAIDEVNPDYHHQHIAELQTFFQHQGYQLIPRLPIYPQFINYLSPRLQQAIQCHWEKVTPAGDRP